MMFERKKWGPCAKWSICVRSRLILLIGLIIKLILFSTWNGVAPKQVCKSPSPAHACSIFKQYFLHYFIMNVQYDISVAN